MADTDTQAIERIVTRGVERVFPNEDFLRSRLSSGEQLKIYLGIDPTGPTLHMGHMLNLMKLAQFQALGHKVILLIGDFTARIGDPDKKEMRSVLTHEQVLENAALYKEQASTLLSFEGENPAELVYNSSWLDTMNFAEVISLASQMTVQRMLDRDMFKKRMEAGTPIYVHEFLYPLMQGYDSLTLGVDGEVGGNDQTYNMLVGRDLQKGATPPKEKFVLPMKLLVDNNGDKMGKTTGNMLSFLDSAEEKFKKIMTWSDEMIPLGFELLTEESLDEVDARLKSGENPRDIKFDLALNIITRFHGSEEAEHAKEVWINDVQQDAVPESMPSVELQEDTVATLSLGLSESKSQVKRLLKEGAIKVNNQKIESEETLLSSGDIVQAGKKRWFSII